MNQTVHTPPGSNPYWRMTIREPLKALWCWLKSHEPVVCAICSRLMFFKDAHYEHLTTGGTFPICKRCHKEIYHPLSEEE